MKHVTPQFIAPECSAPGCHRSGAPHTMVKCRACGKWFCEGHLVITNNTTTSNPTSDTLTERSERIAHAPTIKLRGAGAYDLTYYVGYCATCLDTPAARPENDSTWLR